MRLLFNYLSMKDSDPVARSNKKAAKKGTPANGDNCNTKITKFFSSFYNTATNGNGTPRKTTESTGTDDDQTKRKRGRPRKYDLNGRPLINGTTELKKLKSSSHESTSSSTESSISSSADVKATVGSQRGRPRKDPQNAISVTKKNRKGNNKSSPKLRPRRRASQTYFFKYQLARNPLKAEEEDLKLALLASLQQCGSKPSKKRQQSCQQQELVEDTCKDNNNNQNSQQHKQPKKENHSNHQQHQPNKHQKHKHPPPKQTPSHTQDTVNLQQKTLPVYDEEYLKRYRPDTEDFLTFICFRITAPSHRNELLEATASGLSADTASNLIENELDDEPLNTCATTTTPTMSTGINVKISNDKSSTDYHNLRRSTSPCKSSASNQTASNSSPNHLNSPCNRRRPIRQSPRLATSTNRRSSELEGSNNFTAYDNQTTYEEDIKRAQMALDDMAMEINGSDDNNELAAQVVGGNQRQQQTQNHHQILLSKGIAAPIVDSCTLTSGKSLSPYKNNKHFVENLMTRKFAGTFAESSEEIIFESIKNHQL